MEARKPSPPAAEPSSPMSSTPEDVVPETFAQPIIEVAPIPGQGAVEEAPTKDAAAEDAAASEPEINEQEAPPAAHSMTRQRWTSRQRLSERPPSSRIPEEIAAPLAAIKRRRDNPADIHRALIDAPRDAALLHDLYASLQRGDDLDRRWCIAHTLVYMGEANDAERETHEQHAREGLVRPTRAVNDDEWRELLFHPGEDQLTGEIFGAIAPAMLLGQVTSMRASIVPEILDPSALVDPKRTTLQAVRCLAWAAAFLGLRVPPIFVCPEFDGTADIVLNPTPCTRVGSQCLTGRSSKELAFVAGQHLSWYRREHLLGKPQRSVRRLEDMFLAALTIGNPGLPMTAEIKDRVEPTAQAIRPLLHDDAVEKLKACFTRFVELGGRSNLSRWYKGAERTAACSGLLLANDLNAAQKMISLEQPDQVDAAMDELILFFSAGRCSLLRKRIGIAASNP